MRLIELSAVRHRLHVGAPLPFNVRRADGLLLLAKGHVPRDASQLESLLQRGMLVDIAELEPAGAPARQADASQLPNLWQQAVDRLDDVLLHPGDDLAAQVDEVAEPLVALVERDPDLAVFQVLRQHGGRHAQYGVNHSLHCAIAAFVTAQRLGWDIAATQRGFKAALTMNLSMLELQGLLATQASPPSPGQRAAIHSHPLRTVEMLQQAGIEDAMWLRAVAQHHESADGSGYPTGCREPVALAMLLRQCDIYTARLSPRRSREALAADVAARGLFSKEPGNPMLAALIKEFGVYPPGAFVELASGETALVLRRGRSAHEPLVAVLATPGAPTLRDTAQPSHAVRRAIVGAQCDWPPEQLLALACAA